MKMILALAAAITGSAFGSMPAAMPEFKNSKQLAEWRAEKAAEPAAKATTEDPAFYTGKPYVASSGAYAFKDRSYTPELARWTSEDPSGFPDGANGNIYAPVPTTELDLYGLLRSGGAALWGAYYNYNNYTTADVWAHVGGWLNDKFLEPDANYFNSCALRLRQRK